MTADGTTTTTAQDDGQEIRHEFHDGPWNGTHADIEPSPDGYEHLVPHRSEPGIGEWVPAGAWPDSGRYVRTGSYGNTIVMTWSDGHRPGCMCLRCKPFIHWATDGPEVPGPAPQELDDAGWARITEVFEANQDDEPRGG